MSHQHPITLPIGPHRVDLHWTTRAVYRFDTLPERRTLANSRTDDGLSLAFLLAHVWAMLADERSRRRWRTPEDLAADFDPARDPVDRFWHAVFLQRYDVDLDAPAPDPQPSDGSKAARSESPGGDSPDPSTGTTR